MTAAARRTVAIIQARLGSTRLPGKVLMEGVSGRSLLELMLERVRACRTLDAVVVAAPDLPADDAVAAQAQRGGAQVFRGSEADVLSRYVGAAAAFQAELVVRLTSDCPLMDPAVVDLHVARMIEHWQDADFVTNMVQQTYPLGLAVEAMPADTLRRMDRLSTKPYLREHVTTIAYEKPEWFLVEHVRDTVDRSQMRWTVDYREDLEFVRAVFAALYKPGRIFSFADILDLVTHRPELAALNAHAGK